MSEVWRRHSRSILVAIQFLTVLPIPADVDAKEEDVGRSILWYPFVGLLLGLIITCVAAVLPGTEFLAAVLLVSLWVVLTGGLHLDGLADCADAWLGGLGDKDRTLALLKDPLCGSMAVIVLILQLALKIACLAIVLQSQQWLYLCAVPLIARAALLYLFLETPYIRRGGLGEIIKNNMSRTLAWRSLFCAAILIVVLLPWSTALLFLITALLVSRIVRRSSLKRIGGFTGDVAGAQVELVESALLLVLALSVV